MFRNCLVQKSKEKLRVQYILANHHMKRNTKYIKYAAIDTNLETACFVLYLKADAHQENRFVHTELYELIKIQCNLHYWHQSFKST